MRHRPTKRAAAPAIDRPPLALVRDELPEAIANAAKIDPTILDCSAYHSAATEPPGPVYAIGPVIGQLERFDDFTGDQRVVYRYMSEARDGYLGGYPDFGADPEIEEDIYRLIKKIEARLAQIRAAKATRGDA